MREPGREVDEPRLVGGGFGPAQPGEDDGPAPALEGQQDPADALGGIGDDVDAPVGRLGLPLGAAVEARRVGEARLEELLAGRFGAQRGQPGGGAGGAAGGVQDEVGRQLPDGRRGGPPPLAQADAPYAGGVAEQAGHLGALDGPDAGVGEDAAAHHPVGQGPGAGEDVRGRRRPAVPAAGLPLHDVAGHADPRRARLDQFGHDARQQLLERPLTALQHDVGVPVLRHTRPGLGSSGEAVALDHGHRVGMGGEHVGGEQARESAAYDDGVPGPSPTLCMQCVPRVRCVHLPTPSGPFRPRPPPRGAGRAACGEDAITVPAVGARWGGQ